MPSPQHIPVIFEDDSYIAINKPSGLLVQPKSKQDNEPTVVDFIKDKTTDSGIDRPGIVHRLDRGTSGVMLLAKTKEARKYAQKQFAERKVQKTYIAIVEGRPKDNKFIIDIPIQRNPKLPATFRVNASGKPSQSLVEVLKYNGKRSLLQIKPKTGRTHQIRVHLQYIGLPIINDYFYSKSATQGRLMLHSEELLIKLLGGEEHKFLAPRPDEFSEVMDD